MLLTSLSSIKSDFTAAGIKQFKIIIKIIEINSKDDNIKKRYSQLMKRVHNSKEVIR